MKMRKMNLEELSERIDPVVAMRKNQWYLVSADNREGKTNALTAAWGAFGNFRKADRLELHRSFSLSVFVYRV